MVEVARELAVCRRRREPLHGRVALGEPLRRHALRGAYGQGRLFWVGKVHRPELAAEEAGGGERLDLFVLTHSLEPLADVHERGHDGIARPEHAGHPRADVRAGHGLRRDVARVPVVLVPRVEDAAEIRLDVRADERCPVEHLGDLGQAVADLHAVDRGGDRGERADHVGDRKAGLERLVSLRVERVRSRHAAGHPEDDHRVGPGRRMHDAGALLRATGPRLRQGKRGGRGGGQALEEIAAGFHVGHSCSIIAPTGTPAASPRSTGNQPLFPQSARPQADPGRRQPRPPSAAARGRPKRSTK